jgi:hypothetical protein
MKATKDSISLEAAPLENVLSVLGNEFATGVLQVRLIHAQTPT